MDGNLSRYILDPGPKPPAVGLKAAATTDSAIVTETIFKVLRSGGNAADAAVAGAFVQAAVEPFMTNHAGLVTLLYYEARTQRVHRPSRRGSIGEKVKGDSRAAPEAGRVSDVRPGDWPPAVVPARSAHTGRWPGGVRRAGSRADRDPTGNSTRTGPSKDPQETCPGRGSIDAKGTSPMDPGRVTKIVRHRASRPGGLAHRRRGRPRL